MIKQFQYLITFACALIYAWTLNAQPAQPPAFTGAMTAFQQARTARANKDYAAYLRCMQTADSLTHNHPVVKQGLARAFMLTMMYDEALSVLEQYAAMGLAFAVEQDTTFQPLHRSPRFEAILRKFAQNRMPLVRSKRVYTLKEGDLAAEGLAFAADTKTLYVSSIHKRKILALHADGSEQEIATERDGLWGVYGMSFDKRRHVLWVCATAVSQVKGLKEEEKGFSGVFAFDVRKRRLIKSYFLHNHPDKEHSFKDLAINAKGDVFVSDMKTQAIFRINAAPHGGDSLETFVPPGTFAGLLGLSLSSDGQTLFAADNAQGIYAVDVKKRTVQRLEHPLDVSATGIDGLYYYQGNLIATQHTNTDIPRVQRFVLNKSHTRIERSETIESRHPDYDYPTLGSIVGTNFYYIANSQWNLFSEQGTVIAPEKLKATIILVLPLKYH